MAPIEEEIAQSPQPLQDMYTLVQTYVEQLLDRFSVTLRSVTRILDGIALCLSLAILAAGVHTLWTYTHADTAGPWFLSLWPTNFELNDVRAEIASAAGVALLNTLVLASESSVFASSAPHRRSLIVLLAAGIAPLVAAIFGFLFPAVVNAAVWTGDNTLLSWTCSWNGAPSAALTTNLPAELHAPSWFGGLCTESRFAFYAFVPLVLLQSAVLVCVWIDFLQKRRDSIVWRISACEKGVEQPAEAKIEAVVHAEKAGLTVVQVDVAV